MSLRAPQFLSVGTGVAERRIAYLIGAPAGSHATGLVWLPGFKSEMTSTKAAALAEWSQPRDICLTRFDYSGHGQSSGNIESGSIGQWLEEAREVFERLTTGSQILVGSSMGGYLALLVLRTLLRENPAQAARIRALVLIAPAWDMTETLMWARFSQSVREEILRTGVYRRPSRYGDGPYPITRTLIEDGRKHLIGHEPFDPRRPVHVLHGLQDPDVPWEHTLDLAAHLSGDWVRVTAVADGDHRLSRPEDLALLTSIIGDLAEGTP